jgi:hypothetical protein
VTNSCRLPPEREREREGQFGIRKWITNKVNKTAEKAEIFICREQREQ